MAVSKIDKHTELIRDLIKNYKRQGVTSEFGYVVTNSDGVLTITGLNNVKLNEMLIVSGEYYAVVMSLNSDLVGAVMVSDFSKIQEGAEVKKAGYTFSTPTGSSLLGRVIDPLGRPLDGLGEISYANMCPVERDSPGVMQRKSVTEPLYTGILSVDSLIPVGKGQRELIIGDKQTGKTALALDAIINQADKNCYCVYVAIGQKNSTVNKVVLKLKEMNVMQNTVVVNASASDLPALKFLAPFVGVTIAEEWMKAGKDVLIVYDDLTQHAISYRTMSLLLEFAPGREAYPGDIFYLHSRLLERAGRLNEQSGGGSITALPIIQTQADDISAYIPTNCISITDGQIFLKSLLFNQGQRPAVDVTLSVSRVGGAAQKKGIKDMSSTLKLELANYFELLEFSKFGSDLNERTKYTLGLGERIQKCMVQVQNAPRTPEEELFILFLIKERHIMKVEDVNDVVPYLSYALKKFNVSAVRSEIDLNQVTPLHQREAMRKLAADAYAEYMEQKVLKGKVAS